MTLSAHIAGSCIVPAVQQACQGHRLLLTLSSVAVSMLTYSFAFHMGSIPPASHGCCRKENVEVAVYQ